MDLVEVSSLVDSFRGRRVAVVGDVMVDTYLDGTTQRLCREAPVPLLADLRSSHCPGGAANVAANLALLGAEVALVGLTGADRPGRHLRRVLEGLGVDVDGLVVEADRTTLQLHRVRSGGQLLVRFDRGDRRPPGAWSAAVLARKTFAVAGWAELVVVSDYEAGVWDAALRQRLAGCTKPLVVDARNVAAYRPLRPLAVTPNWSEVVRLVGGDAPPPGTSRPGWVAANACRILDGAGAAAAVVTLDAEGAVVIEAKQPLHRTFARPVTGTAAIGAGDAFVAALALGLGGGASLPAAAEIAARAAEVAVRSPDTALCRRADLMGTLDHRHIDHRHIDHRDIVAGDLAELTGRLSAERAAGRRIVLVNGCFDLLHRGHLSCLAEAKALGDVLVVGVNDDRSVRRLKGPGRPVNPLADRLAVLAGLSGVDHVVAFAGDTADELLEVVRPALYVKGGDHRAECLPEAAQAARVGAKLVIVGWVAQSSTSALLDQIRREAVAAPS